MRAQAEVAMTMIAQEMRVRERVIVQEPYRNRPFGIGLDGGHAQGRTLQGWTPTTS